MYAKSLIGIHRWIDMLSLEKQQNVISLILVLIYNPWNIHMQFTFVLHFFYLIDQSQNITKQLCVQFPWIQTVYVKDITLLSNVLQNQSSCVCWNFTRDKYFLTKTKYLLNLWIYLHLSKKAKCIQNMNCIINCFSLLLTLCFILCIANPLNSLSPYKWLLPLQCDLPKANVITIPNPIKSEICI